MADAGMTTPDVSAGAAVVVRRDELPVFCPNRRMPLWSSHPRVFLDMGDTGQAMCPYCGTRYRLADGLLIGGGH